MAMHDALPRAPTFGCDESKLGRWTWVRLQARENRWLRIIAAYRPVISTELGSTYVQHERYFRALENYTCPRKQFLIDLKVDLKVWLAAGDHIILGMDANEDVRSGAVHHMLSELGLRELILDLHEGHDPPETCYKNTQRVPIDGLFGTHGIQPTAGGYTRYDQFCVSDHRGLWIDVPYQSALGYNPPDLHKQEPKLFQSGKAEQRERYIKQVEKMFRIDKNRIPAAAAVLREMVAQQTNPVQIKGHHHRLLQSNNELRMQAARDLHTVYRGPIAWSPEWRHYKDMVELWTRALRRHTSKRGAVNGKSLNTLMRKCGITDVFRLNQEQTEERLAVATELYEEICPKAEEFRKKHLESCAAKRAELNKSTEEAEIRKQMENEKQRKTAAQIRRLRPSKKKGKKGLATKLYRTVDQEEVLEETKEGVEATCFEEAEARFSQATEISDFLQEPLLSQVGMLCEGPAAEAIVNGTYVIPEGLNRWVHLVIAHLKRPPQVEAAGDIDVHISTAEHIKGWKKQREFTGCDMHGPDFSHHMAGAHHPVIAEVDAAIRSAPLEVGFMVDLWEMITDAAIPKKEEDIRAAAMRFIGLMVPEFNINNKWMSKRIMEHCEDLGILATEQGGSRKERRAALLALNWVLFMDILRQKKRAGFFCSNDAIQCYDRIAHNFAMLSLRRVGVPWSALRSMFGTLQNAVHYVKTGYGVSKSHYGGKIRKLRGKQPLMGVIQGNGAGPTIWVCISTVLLNILDSEGHGAYFKGSMTLLLFVVIAMAFVDDADITSAARDAQTRAVDELAKFQTMVDCWKGCLRVTGGDLGAPKSCWGLIDFTWTNEKWRYMTDTQAPGELTFQMPDGTRIPLQRKDPNEAHKTLGIWMAADGNQDAQAQYLRDETMKFADQYRTGGPIEKNAAWEGVTTTIMNTLKWSAAATQLTEANWDWVSAPVFKAGLPKSGISRMFPRTVVFGPSLYQGLGIMHPFHNQEIEHLQTIIQQVNRWDRAINKKTADPTGERIQRSLEELRSETGLPGLTTDWDYEYINLAITDCWLKTVLKYCDKHGISLHDDLPKHKLVRIGDINIMEAFYKQGKHTNREYKILNIMRLSQGLVTLADFTTACGRYITTESSMGKRHDQRFHKYEWQRTPDSLTTEYLTLWNKAVQECFLNPYEPRQLSRRLGDWLVDPLLYSQWAVRILTNELMEREEDGWRIYTCRTVARPNTVFTRTTRLHTTLPQGSKVATVSKTCFADRVLFVSHSDHRIQPDTTPPSPLTIEEAREDLPELDQWAVETLFHKDNGAHVAKAIREGTCRAVTDGSHRKAENGKPAHGTAAFSLHGDDPKLWIWGQNRTPGHNDDQDSMRAELGGIDGALTVIEMVVRIHGNHGGKVTIGLDAEAAENPAKQKGKLWSGQAHYDMLMDVHQRIQDLLPIQFGWHHIIGHADDKVQRELDWWELMNLKMDTKAKAFLRRTLPRPNQRFTHEGWNLTIDGRRLTKYDKEEIYSMLHVKDIKEYWMKKHTWEEKDFQTVNWQASKKALKAVPRGTRRFLAKFATGHCAVGRMMNRRGEWKHSKCPGCGARNGDYKACTPMPKSQGKNSVDHIIRQTQGLDGEESHLPPPPAPHTRTSQCLGLPLRASSLR